MKITQHPLTEKDASTVTALRQATAKQKGVFLGAKARDGFDAMKRTVPMAPDVRVEAGEVGGIPGWWCRPLYGRPDAKMLYLHGGCFVLGSAESFRNQVSHYARVAEVDTFIVDYRRAPGHRFPAAADDAWAAYAGLVAQGVRKIVLAGDSAGGNLALGILATALEKKVKLPLATAVMSPWVDLALTGESMQTRADADPLFTKDVFAQFVGAYVDEGAVREPRVSPLYGPLAGLPPIRIDVGGAEILFDDATRYAARAEEAGVDVTLNIWSGMPHSFQQSVGKLDAAELALQEVGQFLKQRLA